MTSSASLLDRTFDWFLDRDGDLYGDEQERLRWYEASAVAQSIQIPAVTWAIAIAVVVTRDRAVAVTAGAVLAAVWLPLVLMTGYAQRRHVRTTVDHWSAKRIIITAVSVLPYLVTILGVVLSFGMDGTMLAAFIASMAGGAGLAAFGTRRNRRREQARELDEADVE